MTRYEVKSLINETLSNRRLSAEADTVERRNRVYADYPEVQDMDRDINLCRLAIARAILTDNKTLAVQKDDELNELISNKETYLEEMGISLDYNQPRFFCRRCNDTGFINVDGANQKCACAIELENKLYADVTGIHPSNFTMFDDYSLAPFSNEVIINSSLHISPKENMETILCKARTFVDSILTADSPNLLFMGSTGTGKTYLAKTICSELLANGTFCVYRTAPQLFDCLLNNKMGKYDSDSLEAMTAEKIYSAPVLVIDDLGTEVSSPAKYADFISILDNRANYNGSYPRKTIIVTNLKPKELKTVYDERIASRLLGTGFSLCYFEGKDIRFGQS
ncbi:MAG: ATP-binding protein [Clostridia bacterium]|nr:ATP-binding protein [Clostridia bacterium]